MKLIPKTVYLCGPIMGCTDEECNDWRELVTREWNGRVLDPMRRDYRGRELEAYEEVVTLDKVDIAQSDALLVNYPGPSVGTAMEVLLAFQTGKLVVVVAAPGVRMSPWLRYHSHAIVPTFHEGISKLREHFRYCQY